MVWLQFSSFSNGCFDKTTDAGFLKCTKKCSYKPLSAKTSAHPAPTAADGLAQKPSGMTLSPHAFAADLT